MNMQKLLLLLSAVLVTSGCAHTPLDAPWDPKPNTGQTLFDQIPNWDNAADLRCGGHLTPQEARRQGRTQRC